MLYSVFYIMYCVLSISTMACVRKASRRCRAVSESFRVSGVVLSFNVCSPSLLNHIPAYNTHRGDTVNKRLM